MNEIIYQEFNTLPALNAAMKAAGIYNPTRDETQGHWIFTGPDGTQYVRCKFPQTGWHVCAIENARVQVTRNSGAWKGEKRFLKDIQQSAFARSFGITPDPMHAMTLTANQAQDVAAWLRTTAAGALYQIEVI